MKNITSLIRLFSIISSMLFCYALLSIAQSPVNKSLKAPLANKYAGSYFKGNYVWGGAMNLAWLSLNSDIVKGKIKIKTADKVVLEMVAKLNNPPFSKNDLDEKSYYIKSGYGQTTVDAINKESKAKFPSKSFTDLTNQLKERDIIAYAYFLKQVKYLIPFTTTETSFLGHKVAGFYAWKEKERDNVRILHYENDDKFILTLQLKDDSDQLILAKGYNMTSPAIIVNEIKHCLTVYPMFMDNMDNFEAPKLNLDYQRDYVELLHKPFVNKGFENYAISQMVERLQFHMDQQGARVENEAVIEMETTSIQPGQQKAPRHFVLNKPFWVVMQRKGSQNPYFLLGINNIELMEKLK